MRGVDLGFLPNLKTPKLNVSAHPTPVRGSALKIESKSFVVIVFYIIFST